MDFHRVFYINTDGLNKKEEEKLIYDVRLAVNNVNHNNIVDYIIPVHDTPSKIEFINPILITKKKLEKELNASVEELTSYLKDEIIILNKRK